MLGDDIVDVYRAFLAEIYDELATAGFPDIPQAATTVFRDIDGRGSRIGDLAVQAGVTELMMRSVIDELVTAGYATIEGGLVMPAERGHAAFIAGRRALEAVEDRWAARLGPRRFTVFKEVLRELASDRMM
jgi:hypothetical protein